MANYITVLSVLIAIAGIMLILALFARMNEINKVHKTKRNVAPGLADLLNYASLVTPSIVLMKNGALMTSWIYRGEDNANETAEQLEYLTARINQALMVLGSGWMMHINSVRMETPSYSSQGDSFFEDRVTKAIDEERRRFFMSKGNLFEGCHYLSVTYLPPLLAEKKFREMMFSNEAETDAENNKNRHMERTVEYFQRQVDHFEMILSSVLKLQRLGATQYEYEDGSKHFHSEILEYLHFCITGISQPITVPSNTMYLDNYIGGQDCFVGNTPSIGDKYIAAVSIDGFPPDSYPSMMSSLADISVSCRISHRFIPLESYQAEGIAQAIQRKWKQKQRGLVSAILNKPETESTLDQDAVMMTDDAGDALTEIRSGLVGFGYYTCVVILMEEDREVLDEAARQVQKKIMNLGFNARIEEINTFEAYLGTLPGHGTENLRRYFINTINVADLLPTSSIWSGLLYNPCPFYPPEAPALAHCVTTGNTPYRLNCHVRDVGHTVILGPIGSGKSTLLNFIAAQARRYRGATVFAFDKGQSMYTLCKAAGGTHYNIAGENSNLAFAPFQHLDTQADRAWLLDWVERLVNLNGVFITPEQRSEIGRAIESLHRNKLQDESANLSITNFLGELQSNVLRTALEQYDVGGSMGHLLAAERDSFSDNSDFICFEIEQLMELGDKWALPVLDYLFRRIYKRLKGQPAWICLDEAWLLFKHPVFASKIIEWLKVFRKANCSVILATQSLGDVTDAASSSLMTALIESTASKIFLPNVYARNEESAALYRKFGLNSQQISIIATATPKRQYYHHTQQGSRLFELALGSLTLAFIGVSDPETLALVREFEAKYGESWQEEWVKRKGIDLNEYAGAI